MENKKEEEEEKKERERSIYSRQRKHRQTKEMTPPKSSSQGLFMAGAWGTLGWLHHQKVPLGTLWSKLPQRCPTWHNLRAFQMASRVSWTLWACTSSLFLRLLSPSSFPFPSFSLHERMLTASASWGLQTAITATLTQDGGGQVQPGRNGCSTCYQIFAPDKMPCHCCEWSLLLLTSVSLKHGFSGNHLSCLEDSSPCPKVKYTQTNWNLQVLSFIYGWVSFGRQNIVGWALTKHWVLAFDKSINMAWIKM